MNKNYIFQRASYFLHDTLYILFVFLSNSPANNFQSTPFLSQLPCVSFIWLFPRRRCYSVFCVESSWYQRSAGTLSTSFLSVSGYWLQLYPKNENTIEVQQPVLATHSRNRSIFQSSRMTRGQLTYKCTNCNRSYMRMSCLKRHLRVECGQAPKYQCKICHGWFKYKHNLTAHWKMHVEEPKYNCDLCPKKFYRRDRLLEHQKRLHNILPMLWDSHWIYRR